MAQCRSTQIIPMIKWNRTSRLSIKKSFSFTGTYGYWKMTLNRLEMLDFLLRSGISFLIFEPDAVKIIYPKPIFFDPKSTLLKPLLEVKGTEHVGSSHLNAKPQTLNPKS